jgi:predicted exporter
LQAQQSRQAVLNDKLLGNDGALSMLAAKVGEGRDWVNTTRRNLLNSKPLSVEDFLASPASEPWRHLWLGKIGKEYASVVMLRGVTRAALPTIEKTGEGLAGVQWVDRVGEISSVLGRYRQHMAWVLMFAYVAVCILLYARYGVSAWRVIAPVVLASAAAVAVLSSCGQPMQLFHVLALMLLLGIGIDYGVFLHERASERDDISWLAVGLSAASTLLSFGLLGLSATPALRAFGLTMLIGTTLVWLGAPCFLGAAKLHEAHTLPEESCSPS